MADILELVMGILDLYAKITLEAAPMTYIATAKPGTVHTAARWRVKRIEAIDANTNVTKWADGNDNFDNVAGANGANLSSLSYS